MYSKNAMWKRLVKDDPKKRIVLGKMPDGYMLLMNKLNIPVHQETNEQVQVIDGHCTLEEFYASGRGHKYEGGQFTRIMAQYDMALILDVDQETDILSKIEQELGHFETTVLKENVVRIDFPG